MVKGYDSGVVEIKKKEHYRYIGSPNSIALANIFLPAASLVLNHFATVFPPYKNPLVKPMGLDMKKMPPKSEPAIKTPM